MKEDQKNQERKSEQDYFLQPVSKDEARSYQHIFNALQREPELKLSKNFADKIVDKIISRQSHKTVSKEYVWFGSGILAILISFIFAIMATDFSIDLGFLKGISGYSGLFIFGFLFVVLLHLIDKKWIHQALDDKEP